MINQVLARTAQSVRKRVWIFSDLQLQVPEESRRCFETAIQDYKHLNLPCDYIWYLGDATEGKNEDALREMCDMQIEGLKSLNVPVRYVMGNHEFDLLRSGVNRTPFFEAATKVPGWKSIERIDDFYFFEHVGDYMVAFFSDHADAHGKWCTGNGEVRGNAEMYPYTRSSYEEVTEILSNCELPVLTVSHYAFEGGNRPSALLNQLLPLPANVKIHFHGHAHIGDQKWAGVDCHRQISTVVSQDIAQINVSSLENIRGSGIRSVFLEMYEDQRLGVFFRNHQLREWSAIFMI